MTEEPEEEEAPVERNPFQEILQKKLQAMGKVLTDSRNSPSVLYPPSNYFTGDELVSKGGESAMSLQIQRAARERMNRPTSDGNFRNVKVKYHGT